MSLTYAFVQFYADYFCSASTQNARNFDTGFIVELHLIVEKKKNAERRVHIFLFISDKSANVHDNRINGISKTR